MKFKPLILFNPKNRKATFAYADHKKILNSTLELDCLKSITKTTYSPVKKISLKSSSTAMKIPC